MREDAEAGSEGAAEAGGRKGGPFGGLSASEAARLSHEKRRRNAQASRPQAGVVVAVDEAAVVRRLTSEAEHGNVQAARELREWLDRAKQDTDDHGLHLLDVLTPEERATFMGWMLAHETPAR